MRLNVTLAQAEALLHLLEGDDNPVLEPVAEDLEEMIIANSLTQE